MITPSLYESALKNSALSLEEKNMYNIKYLVMDVDGTLTDGKYIWEIREKYLRHLI